MGIKTGKKVEKRGGKWQWFKSDERFLWNICPLVAKDKNKDVARTKAGSQTKQSLALFRMWFHKLGETELDAVQRTEKQHYCMFCNIFIKTFFFICPDDERTHLVNNMPAEWVSWIPGISHVHISHDSSPLHVVFNLKTSSPIWTQAAHPDQQFLKDHHGTKQTKREA